MPIVTRCPNPDCGQAYRLPDEQVGKIGRCKSCQTRFRVRAGEGELVESGGAKKQPSGPGPSPSGQTQFMEPKPSAESSAERVPAIDPTATQFGASTPDDPETDSAIGRAETGTVFIESLHPHPAIAADASDDQGQTPDLAATPSATGAADPAALKSAEDSVPLAWTEGDVILDLYEVKQIHHGGGMGLVYRAHHKSWNLDLAVKSPRPNSVDTEQKKLLFERECETWINLGLHPNTVSCYYVRRLGGIPRVFAEYVDGGDLEDWIQDGRLYEGGPEAALKRIVDTAIQFAWGLKYAHDQGLVHHDVKPANVMMTSDRHSQSEDFGLAKAGGALAKGTAAPANPQVIFGGMTEACCSPEQANRQKLSHRTDIWSWAVSVFEMFTGEVTWPGGAVAGHSLESYLDESLADESKPKMPEGLAALLRHCFQKAPDESSSADATQFMPATHERDNERPKANPKVYCPQCGQRLAGEVAFCVHCGQRIEPATAKRDSAPKATNDSSECTCGSRNSPGNRFCNPCGKPLSKILPTCPACKQPASGVLAFCLHCGAKF